MMKAFLSSDFGFVDLMYDFYGDDIQSQLWQINAILKQIAFSWKSNDPKLFKKLFEFENIDSNFYNDNYTLLTYACENNQKEIVSILINLKGCNVNFCPQKR